MPVDNPTLHRWRSLDAAVVLVAVAEHAKQDLTFKGRIPGETRWNATVRGVEFCLLLNGPKFYDKYTFEGGGGGIDLIMHLTRTRDFKKAVSILKSTGL